MPTVNLPTPRLVRNITTAEKRSMQLVLKDLGLYTDVVDGRWGSNSIKAMAAWQQFNRYDLTDGIPTYEQMVRLGATVPEVLPKPKSSVPGGILKLLLNVAVPFFFNQLPKVSLPMNIIAALSRINKAWIAALVSFISVNILAFFFGINITAETQTVIVTVLASVAQGVIVWLVPNAPPVQSFLPMSGDAFEHDFAPIVPDAKGSTNGPASGV